MPRITQTRIGSVYLKYLPGENKWRASWWDPKNKKHRRFRLNATSYQEAKEQCQEINRQLAQDSGFLPRSETSPHDLTVEEALLSAISNTNAGKHQISCYVSNANKYLEWLSKHHPRISHWRQLRPEILEQYIRWVEQKGYAHDTVRARALVLRMTSRHLVSNYFDLYRDIAMGLKVCRKRPVKVQVLSINELGVLLSFAKKFAPETYVCMVLQSMAGLRILEALSLRERDMNWQEGTIEITETGRHRPKNLYSFRTIPVAPQVLKALLWERSRTNIKPVEGLILNNSRGGPYCHDNISKRIKNVLRRLSIETSNPKFAQLRPRELRSTFITLARKAGAEERYVKRYVGHSPSDIMGTHYEAVTIDDLRTKVVDVFLGAYGEKLNTETEAACCTMAAQSTFSGEYQESLSAVK